MKILKYLSFTIVFLFGLTIYTGLVHHIGSGGMKFQQLKDPITRIAKFPWLIRDVLNSPQITGIADTYRPLLDKGGKINQLDYNLFATTSFWSENEWKIDLINLHNSNVHHTWKVIHAKDKFLPKDLMFANSVPRHSLLLDDKSLIVQLVVSPNLMRLDSLSNITWLNQDFNYHHSIELDSDSNLWVCGFPKTMSNAWNRRNGVSIANQRKVLFDDELIIKIDPNNGKTLYKKSVGEILVENSHAGLLLGHRLNDALHLNDIQPALFSGNYWKKGDLFLSLRGRSAILQYRPEKDSLIRVITGPFFNQHDVDILNEHEISIFNNNAVFEYQYRNLASPDEEVIKDIKSSNYVVYNFENNSFSTPYIKTFEEQNIFTQTEGLSHTLKNGDIFIEEQNSGMIYILSEGEIIYRSYFEAPIHNYLHTTNWIRIYETLPIKSRK